MDIFLQAIDIPVKVTTVTSAVGMFFILTVVMLGARQQDQADRRCRDHQVETPGAKPRMPRPRPQVSGGVLPHGYWDGAEMVESDRFHQHGYPEAA